MNDFVTVTTHVHSERGEQIVSLRVDRKDLAHWMQMNQSMAALDGRRPGQPMLDTRGREMPGSYDVEAVNVADREV